MTGDELDWANAALRPELIERVEQLGTAALPAVERVLTPSIGLHDFDSKTGVVTAIGVLEALASTVAIARLQQLAQGARPMEAAHAIAALRRLGQTPPVREAPPGPSREALVHQLADGTAKERELALASALRHADLALLPLIRSALEHGSAKVREEAARTCGRYGDSWCLEPLLERLRARPPAPPSKPGRGALPSAVRDALGAWNGLAELGDVRACDEIERFEQDASYARLRADHSDHATVVFARLCRSRLGR